MNTYFQIMLTDLKKQKEIERKDGYQKIVQKIRPANPAEEKPKKIVNSEEDMEVENIINPLHVKSKKAKTEYSDENNMKNFVRFNEVNSVIKFVDDDNYNANRKSPEKNEESEKTITQSRIEVTFPESVNHRPESALTTQSPSPSNFDESISSLG